MIETEDPVVDVPQTLLASRKLFLMQDVTPEVVNDLIAKMLVLDAMDNEDPIELWINSGGGEVSSGLALYDIMRTIDSPIHTFCIGEACSMAAVILAAGDKRFAFENARIMIHQPSGGITGTSAAIDVYSKEIDKLKGLLSKILAKHTKKAKAVIDKDVQKDTWMDAKKARSYGIIDKIIVGNKK